MKSIKDIIPQVIEGLYAKKPASSRNFQDSWNRAVGDNSNHCVVKDFQKGFLRVHVNSSAKMFELSTRKFEIISKLKNEIPELVDIIFKVGKIN